MSSLEFELAQLRHAYKQLADGAVVDQRRFADGLIAPAIRKIEKILREEAELVATLQRSGLHE